LSREHIKTWRIVRGVLGLPSQRVRDEKARKEIWSDLDGGGQNPMEKYNKKP